MISSYFIVEGEDWLDIQHCTKQNLLQEWFDADRYTDFHLSLGHERCDKNDIMSPNKKIQLEPITTDDGIDIMGDYENQRLLSGKSLLF